MVKKIAVLLGWMGSKEPFLVKYKKLYESLGWDVMIEIAPPSAVLGYVHSAGESSDTNKKFIIPSSTNHRMRQQHQQHDGSMEKVAEDLHKNLLAQVNVTSSNNVVSRRHAKDSNDARVLIHSFSNGGAFLCLQLSSLLGWDSGNTTYNNHEQTQVQTTAKKPIRLTLAGLVFDSCPCYFENLDKIYNAALLRNVFGEEHSKEIIDIIDSNSFSSLKNETNHSIGVGDQGEMLASSQVIWNMFQNKQYFRHTTDTHSSGNGRRIQVPELYIFAREGDDLTAYQPLKHLIEYRTKRILAGNNETKYSLSSSLVQSLVFEQSRHCQHLKYHETDYIKKISEFVDFCDGRYDDEKEGSTFTMSRL